MNERLLVKIDTKSMSKADRIRDRKIKRWKEIRKIKVHQLYEKFITFKIQEPYIVCNSWDASHSI